VKTAISLPDSVFAEAEALAQQLGLSRSELYSKALQADLSKYNRQQILSKLNNTEICPIDDDRMRITRDLFLKTNLRCYSNFQI
jgi:metal-responsive CopG/Arc/MetJ family transcriptional regulator